MNKWYAFQMNAEDNAWDGDGTENRAEAIKWLRSQVENGNTEARVAVIDVEDSFCLEEITADEI